MSQFKIDLTTGDRFWTPKGLGAMGMDPHRAIAELVANSLDWRREAKDNVAPIIEVIVSKSSIEIRDNGVGMTIKELQDAIQVSVSNDATRKNLRIRKGMFGMGMKVACLTLGWKISIHTRPISEKNVENVLVIDTRLLDNSNKKHNYRDNILGEKRSHDNNSPLNGWVSGTSITIQDLTHKSLIPTSIKDSLQEIFSPEIGVENVKIAVKDAISKEEYVCKKIEVPIIEKSKIDLDELKLFVKPDATSKPMQIKGWLALMKVAGSGSGKWGLHLFKNNQIIERYHQLPIRLGGLMAKNPHPEYARTYGEIHLDMCKPAFHKVGFDYSTESWHKVQELLEPHIKVIMEEAKNYKKYDQDKAERSVKRVQQHRKASKKAVMKLQKVKSDPDKPDNAIVLPDGQWFTVVEPIFEDLHINDKMKPWIYNYREKSHELAIIINKQSPIYKSFETVQPTDPLFDLILNWSISECIVLLLYDKFDFTISDAFSVRNEQLSILFKIKEEE